VITCPACGWENADGVAACDGCRSPLAGPGAGPQQAPSAPAGEAFVAPQRPAAPQGPPPLPQGPPPDPPGPVPSGLRAARTVGAPAAPPSVPRRSIPVRVAPTPTRQAGHRAVPAPGPGAGPLTWPGPAEQLCRLCGRSLPAGRRFCTCGADLVHRPGDEPARVPAAPSWLAEWSAHCRFRSAQRAAVGGAPVRYDAPLSPRTRLVRLLLVLLALAVLASQFGPWGNAVRHEVAARVDRVVAAPSAAGPGA
jgi:hypothetical protein